MKLLLTGAGGFVGSHLLSHVLKETDWDVDCICSWRHRGEPARLLEDSNYQANKSRVRLFTHDLSAPITPQLAAKLGCPDVVWNVASDSHVDRSITHPADCVTNNVALAVNMLEFAREVRPGKFIQFSTDEVYGPAPLGVNFREWSTIVPSNPYAASKAAQEAVAISYWRTYNLPITITNTMNVIGERQDKEKFLPKLIRAAVMGEHVKIHAYPDGKTAGSRFYIHARNVASAMLFITGYAPEFEGPLPPRYNIVGEEEINNQELAELVADIVGKRIDYELVDFHSSRPGHDCRYALDGSKLAALGWKPPVNFRESLKRTIEWTLNNPRWFK